MKMFPAPTQKIDVRLWVERVDHESLFEDSLLSIKSLIEQGFAFHEVSLSLPTIKLRNFEALFLSPTLAEILESEQLMNFTIKVDAKNLSDDQLSVVLKCSHYLLEKSSEISVVVETLVDLNDLQSEVFLKKLAPLFTLQKEFRSSGLAIYFVISDHQQQLLGQNIESTLHCLQDKVDGFFEISVRYIDDLRSQKLVDQLERWKSFFKASHNQIKLKDLSLTMAEKNKHALGRLALLISGNKVYHLPTIYNLIPHGFAGLEIKDTRTGTLMSSRDELVTGQLLYANQTEQCSQCNNLIACTGNYVLKVMEDQNIKECVFPLELLKELEIF
ncbi:MAG: hypothetical protein ACLGHN_11965 [Bacteriovoracia bacterium]